MKNKISITLLAVFLMTITACKESNKNKTQKTSLTEDNSILVTDKFGEVRIPKSPERVVAYNYGVIDIMDALGVSDRIIGFSKSNTPDYLKKFKDNKDLINFGGTKDPNFEKINNANPDFIITEPRIEKDHEELQKIAPALFMNIGYDDYIGDIKKNVRTLGKIFEKEDKAEALITDLEKTIDENRAPDTDKKALVVMFNNNKFAAFGHNSRYGFIYDDFGVPAIANDIAASTHGYNISSEYIQEQNPDIIYVIDKNAAHHEGNINKKGVENKLVQETNAYKNGKIIYLTPDLWYYGGGGIQAMEMMAEEIGSAFKK